MFSLILKSSPGLWTKISANSLKASNAIQTTSLARFSTRHSKNDKWKRDNFQKVVRDPQDLPALPEFHSLLRQLYRKSHPDLLRASHPEFAEVNDSSMQLLNGILSTIKKYNQYPAQIVKTIPFYVKKGDQLEVANLRIKTAGGECRRALTTSFREFFIEAGITTKETGVNFKWGKDYFPTEASENDELLENQ